jgi:Tol biopolymer transport system component
MLALLALPGVAQAAYPGTNGRIFFGSDGDVWSVNPDGTGLTDLTDLPGGSLSGGNPSVSGDGTKVAYVVGSQGTAEIWTMHADGSNPIRLESTNDGELDEHPSLSPDGTRIAYYHEDRIPPPPDPPTSLDRDDWIMNADGTAQALLFNGSQEDYYPVFTPDAASVVVTAETSGGFDLIKIPSTGGPFTSGTNLTNTTGFQERSAAVSPDGSRVAFDRYAGSAHDIYSVSISGGDLQPIAASPTVGEVGPAYSPDGTKILYVADGIPMIADASGANPLPLDTGAATFPSDFDWAPAQAVPPGPGPTPDTTAPGTSFKKKPKNRIKTAKATYKFTSTEPGSTFSCRLDKGKFKACRSPRKLKHLKPGKHTFQVLATDAAGNADSTPAKDSFRVVAG